MGKEGIHLTPNADSIPEAEAYISGVLEEASVSMKTSYTVDVVMDEMYSNIVNYSGAQNAWISCKVDAESIVITLEDDGVPYNPLQKEDPDVTLSVEEREVGGLGIFIVKKIMDEIQYAYQDGRNCVTMKKLLHESE